jgi:hypothetical protein
MENGHAIRLMMTRWAEQLPALSGIIEMDEKFIGGKPRNHYGKRQKGGDLCITFRKTLSGFALLLNSQLKIYQKCKFSISAGKSWPGAYFDHNISERW